jgi:hypothetical protein
MPYPSLEDVLNLSRVYLNDTFAGATGMVGEGRIFVDSWLPILTIFNEALEAYQRDTETSNVPALQKEVTIAAVPPINGVNGVGQPDPAVNQSLGFDGFFDGKVQYSSPALPVDLLAPLEVRQRNNGEFLTFSWVEPANRALESRYQDFSLGQWDWRNRQIQWNGALVAKDVKLLYQAALPLIPTTTPPSAFASTFIALIDCRIPLALRCAYTFSQSRLPAGGASALLARYDRELARVVQRETRRSQEILYERQPYGETGDVWNWMH